jgi:hypothetical protein
MNLMGYAKRWRQGNRRLRETRRTVVACCVKQFRRATLLL